MRRRVLLLGVIMHTLVLVSTRMRIRICVRLLAISIIVSRALVRILMITST